MTSAFQSFLQKRRKGQFLMEKQLLQRKLQQHQKKRQKEK